MREPLLIPLIAIATGVVLGQALDFGIADSVGPGFAFLTLSAISRSLLLRSTTLFLCLIFLGAFFVAWHRAERVPVIDVSSKEIALAEGCVVEPAIFSNDRTQFVLELEPGARAQISVPNHPVALHYGQRVAIEARFRTPHNFNNPGAFDYAAYLARRDVFWTALVPAKGSIAVLSGECGSRWRGWIFGLRTAALDRIDALYPDNNYAAAMLRAVLIGESSGLERVWTEDFRRSGTYHALVISGIHVSVLATVLLALLHFVPISKNKALALTAVVAWVYALVSGFTVPVVRAAAGFTLFLIARIFFRRVRPLNLLAAIAIGYLAWDPLQLFEASFQLSFLSVAAIGAFASPLLEKHLTPFSRAMREINSVSMDPHLEPRAAQMRVELRLAAETIELWTRLPQRFAAIAMALAGRLYFFALELGAVSLCVQIGLALPMAEYFHRISFTGLSANLLIVPLMNALVPAGFLAIATGWHWTATLCDALLRWSAAIAGWHAALEPEWRVPDPPTWLGAAFVVALLGSAMLIRRERFRWPAMLGVTGMLGLMVASPWAIAAEPGSLELTAIDVGQGDSLLLVFPSGATMLIDGGGRLEYGPVKRRSNLEIGEDVVSAYLWSRGIRHLDVIAVTHAHQDHAGGLRALIENFHPDEVWTGANPPAELIREARLEGATIRELRASGPREFGQARIQVLAPLADYVPMSPGNNDSLVLRVTYGQRSFLLMGDLERQEEVRLPPDQVRADVLKVGHHGSRTSTMQAFLDAVAPSVAIVSAGYENSFGHPHADVLARLEARHAAILRTDRLGLATVRTDGRRLRYWVEAWRTPPKILGLPEHLVH